MKSVLTEAALWREPARLAWHATGLPRRCARPTQVIVLPGLAASDVSTIPLRWYLRRVGHHVQGWGLGTHRSHVGTTLNRFERRLADAVDSTGESFALVGWSLGGIIARETARHRPDLVTNVITLGSPITGVRSPRSPDGVGVSSDFERFFAPRRQRPIQAPVTSIYSRHDAVVDWRCSVDRMTPGAINVEVGSSHVGLGLDPDVWRIIADTLCAVPSTVDLLGNSPDSG